jgi:hypothetical protein
MLTYFGGTGADDVRAIHAGPSGFLAIAGVTSSTDLPLAGSGYHKTPAGDRDGFVALINPFDSGEFLISYTSYLGGAGIDIINAVTSTLTAAFSSPATASDNSR